MRITDTSDGERQEHAHGRAREVHVEVAELRQPVAGQAADDGDARRDARRRRHELQEADHEHLREVRQARLAAVVLQIRVRREARDRVERQRRFHVGDAVWIQRQPVLERHDRERRQPHDDVRDAAARPSTASSPAASSGSTPVSRRTRRSIGTRTGSSSVRPPVNTLNMYRPRSRLVAIVNRIVKTTAMYSVVISDGRV